MRPTEQQPTPTLNGVEKSVNDYDEWRYDLANAYGPHCAYCNMPLTHSLEVEHIIAQANGGNIKDFQNLLLSCSPCNKAKSDTIFTTQTHYFPTKNNTQLIFDFEVRKHQRLNKYACIPVPHSNLNSQQKQKAKNTIDLFKLDRVERKNLREDEKMTDLRWYYRHNAWLSANTTLDFFLNSKNFYDTATLKSSTFPLIDTIIKKTGFFSVWYAVFHQEPEILELIRSAFHNTANCFDPKTEQALPRNPNNLNDII